MRSRAWPPPAVCFSTLSHPLCAQQVQLGAADARKGATTNKPEAGDETGSQFTNQPLTRTFHVHLVPGHPTETGTFPSHKSPNATFRFPSHRNFPSADLYDFVQFCSVPPLSTKAKYKRKTPHPNPPPWSTRGEGTGIRIRPDPAKTRPAGRRSRWARRP